MVEELIEEFNVDEQSAHICQLVSDDVEEDLWAKGVLLWSSLALLGLEGRHSKLEGSESLSVEESVAGFRQSQWEDTACKCRYTPSRTCAGLNR